MTLLARTNRPLASVDDPPERIPASAPASAADVNAVLGRGSTFEGKLVFEGTVHINGNFVGEIHSRDTLVIGEGARVQAEIDVGTLIVTGEVIGQIRARQLLEMHAPGRVKGNVMTPTLVVDRGVVFEGACRMENLDGNATEVTTPPA